MSKEKIARRAALELRDGDAVNLGIGLPTMVADYIPEGVHITLESENGILGMGGAADESDPNPYIINAGGGYVNVNPGGSFLDSALSFAVIRGGHLNLAILGALQVDERGSLASHKIPGKKVPGMGGAMDVVTGARRVIITMTHTAKNGAPKILKSLTLPVTAVGRVSMVITELAVIEVTAEGLRLVEVAEGVTPAQVQAVTEPQLIIAPDLKTF